MFGLLLALSILLILLVDYKPIGIRLYLLFKKVEYFVFEKLKIK